MNSPVSQLRFESAHTSAVTLAVFTRWSGPIGPTTDSEGLRTVKFLSGLLHALDLESGPWGLLYTAEGSVSLLNVNDVDRAAAEIVAAFERFDSRETSWLAREVADGFQMLFPTPGLAVALPEEITIHSKEYWDICERIEKIEARRAQIAARMARSERLGFELAQIGERLQRIKSDLSIAKISDDEAENYLGSLGERLEAIRLEQTLGGQS